MNRDFTCSSARRKTPFLKDSLLSPAPMAKGRADIYETVEWSGFLEITGRGDADGGGGDGGGGCYPIGKLRSRVASSRTPQMSCG